jgi:hypothetical protein
MKSIVAFVLAWAGSFAALWYGAHQLFYPPGDWIGAALVSFFFALGVGAVIKARIERRDAGIIARPEGPPQDGARVAIAGTLEATGEILRAPLSGQECLVYDYAISHTAELPPGLGRSKSSNSQPSEIMDRSGLAMAPVVIRSGVRDVRLLAFPGIERFPASELAGGKAERARAYVAATAFTEQSILGATGQVAKVLEDRSGCLRVDWKMTSHAIEDGSRFVERVVAPGAQACVVGLYSAKDNAIVPQADVGGVRLIRGSRKDALEYMRDKGTGSIIGAVLMILAPAPIAYGVLAHREHYAAEHHEPTVRGERREAFYDAVKAGDASAVREAIRHGANVNTLDANGDTALGNAGNAATAAVLLEAGANIEGRGRDGTTPIMVAAGQGRADVVRLLISKNANVNEKSADRGKTALYYAAYSGEHGDIVAMLRAAGARESP